MKPRKGGEKSLELFENDDKQGNKQMSILDVVAAGIKRRDLASEGSRLLKKWENLGLLEGLETEWERQNMAVLLENQAKQLLKETSLMARAGGGDVEGFASVAFPMVRRIFGELIANNLVSVQPMSLPAGLIFFLDFKLSDPRGSDNQRLYSDVNQSVFGQGRLGSQITGGALLTTTNGELGFYHLNQGYSSPTASIAGIDTTTVLSGTYGGQVNGSTGGSFSEELMKLCRFDPEFVSGTTNVAVASIPLSGLDNTSTGDYFSDQNLVAIHVSSSAGHGLFAANDIQVRRLTQYSGSSTSVLLLFNVSYDGSRTPAQLSGTMGPSLTCTFPIIDNFQNGGALGSIQGQDIWGLEAEPQIPELDISVDSISVTAESKKLKAKWTPELGEDLSAFHNLDAEVELTQILTEEIALEIDRQIIVDLINGATAGTYYWSRMPGMFLNRTTGLEVGANTKAPDFTGNVSEWNETLFHTIQDLSAVIHRKTLRGGANFLVCGPEVAAIMEQTNAFKTSTVTSDVSTGTAGVEKVGTVSKKWDVYVDPYFPRNLVLVGRKGSSFLESGYVYAPYVPLQVSPTILGTEDFVPRKIVRTRFARKIVRPDLYGLVIIRGLLGESGS